MQNFTVYARARACICVLYVAYQLRSVSINFICSSHAAAPAPPTTTTKAKAKAPKPLCCACRLCCWCRWSFITEQTYNDKLIGNSRRSKLGRVRLPFLCTMKRCIVIDFRKRANTTSTIRRWQNYVCFVRCRLWNWPDCFRPQLATVIAGNYARGHLYLYSANMDGLNERETIHSNWA